MTEPAPLVEARSCPICAARTALRECPHDAVPTVPMRSLAQADRDMPGRLVNGRYELIALLAEGATGLVYRARSRHGAGDVALKLLRPELARDRLALSRFYREARIAKQLVGPHFVAVLDFGYDDDGGAPYIAMELVGASTLSALAPAPPRRAAALLGQVATALTEAARQGIVHRDLKAANVLVATDELGQDRVWVTDFGVAKDLDSVEATLTRPGEPVGTPSCMAPEQIQGGEVDARADLYALGCLMHRLLTAEPVFRGVDVRVLMRQHLSESPAALPSLLPSGEPPPAPLVVLRDALLAKLPGARPASARAAAEVLGLVAAGDDGAAMRALAALGFEPLADADGETWNAIARGAARPGDSVVVASTPERSSRFPKAALALTLGGVALALFFVVDGQSVSEPVSPPMKAHALGALSSVPAPAFRGHLESPSPPASPEAERQPEAAARITIEVDSSPAAWVHRDGKRLGRTPFVASIAPGFAPFEIELRQSGYVRRRVLVSPTDAERRLVVLEPQPSSSDALGQQPPWRPRPF